MKNLGGLAHTTVTVRDADRADRLTVLLLMGPEPFVPLAEYFAERNFSLASETVYARALGLLIDFIAAKGHLFEDAPKRGSLFNQFAHALRFGTITDGGDPSGLFWLRRRMNTVRPILRAVVELSDWLVEKHSARALNPWRQASTAEKLVFWRKWNLSSADSLLKHIRQPKGVLEESKLARRFAAPSQQPNIRGDATPFPETHFDRLIRDGFRTTRKRRSTSPWSQYNLRDILVALLMHGGGLRISEAFHLWVNDVYADPLDASLAHVRIYHPSEGAIETVDDITGTTVGMNRAAYLAVKHGRRPLNEEGRRTGWKNNAVSRDGHYMPIFWYPAAYGRLFMELFQLYLEYERPPSDLPWLFLTKDGLPMTGKAYAEQYRAAVRRSGLRPLKSAGTTPHGHRHAYGQRLAELEMKGLISPKTIQLCMHHSSVVSQKIYTQESNAAVNDLLCRLGTELGPPAAVGAISQILR